MKQKYCKQRKKTEGMFKENVKQIKLDKRQE